MITRTSRLDRGRFFKIKSSEEFSQTLGNGFQLSSVGERKRVLFGFMLPDDVSVEVELSPIVDAAGYPAWRLRAKPVFVVERNKYFGREVPPDPLAAGKLSGQSEVVVNVAVAPSGEITASTVVDGRQVRGEAAAIDLTWPFELDLDFPHRSHASGSEVADFIANLDGMLSRLTGRKPLETRTRKTSYRVRLRLEFSNPDGSAPPSTDQT